MYTHSYLSFQNEKLIQNIIYSSNINDNNLAKEMNGL